MSPRLAGLALVLLTGCGARTTPADPVEPGTGPLPGLASFTAEMLRHGAGQRSTEQIAETIEFVGGDLWIESTTDYVSVQSRVLSDQLEVAMDLVADLVERPTFPPAEIEKVRSRELDRLSLQQKRPRFLAYRELYRSLYGPAHPYSHYDADPQAIARLRRDDLVGFHREHYVPRNALLVVAGDVTPEQVRELAERHLADWADRPAPSREIPPAPEAATRRVVVVDRPGSTQAEVAFGNVAIRRADPDFVPLTVTNLLLGGNASARLFLNLRERCGYGYGAYSSLSALKAPGPIVAAGAFDAGDTAGALRELFAELGRVTTEPAPAVELGAAKAFLDGTFTMATETPAKLARLVTIQRVHGLPDDYWDEYRSQIRRVGAEEAARAAREHVRPDRGVLVLVGDAARVAWPARRYGEVRIVTAEGVEIGSLGAAPSSWPGGEPAPCPAEAAGEQERAAEPPSAGVPRDFDFPAVDEARLDNGLRVLTVRTSALPVAYVGLVVLSGSAADPLRGP